MNTQTVVSYFGTKAAIARALGITPQAVARWRDRVPLLQQYRLERITDGKLRVGVPDVNRN